MGTRIEMEKRTCPSCGTAFEVRKTWHAFCSAPCKDAYRRASRYLGELYRKNEPGFHKVLSLLQQGIATIAASQPLPAESVAHFANAHLLLRERLAAMRAAAVEGVTPLPESKRDPAPPGIPSVGRPAAESAEASADRRHSPEAAQDGSDQPRRERSHGPCA